MTDKPKRFPIQGGLTISWVAAEHAYEHYVRFFGTEQSLDRLAERGGFGLFEFVDLYRAIHPIRYGNTRLDEATVARILYESNVRPI